MPFDTDSRNPLVSNRFTHFSHQPHYALSFYAPYIGLINVTMNSNPSFLAYASVKNDAPLKALYEKKSELGLKRGEDIVKLNENEYVYKSRAINIFFGIRDKQMYATNDELLYKNACVIVKT